MRHEMGGARLQEDVPEANDEKANKGAGEQISWNSVCASLRQIEV